MLALLDLSNMHLFYISLILLFPIFFNFSLVLLFQLPEIENELHDFHTLFLPRDAFRALRRLHPSLDSSHSLCCSLHDGFQFPL